MAEKPPSQRTWGGRFGTGPAELMTRINASIGFGKSTFNETGFDDFNHASRLGNRLLISFTLKVAIFTRSPDPRLTDI